MDNTQPPQRDCTWTTWIWGVLVLYVATFVLEILSIYHFTVYVLKADWWMWLFLAELAVVAVCVRRQDRRTVKNAVIAALSVMAMGILWWLSWQQWNGYWSRWLVVFGGRWLLALGWLAVGFGLLGALASVGAYIWTDGRCRWFHWMKYWMVTCLFLIPCELAAQWMTRDAHPEPLNLPPALPAVNSDNFLIVAIGGSTTLGFPYQPKISFANVAASCLQESMSLPCTVSNLAKTGANFRNSVEQLSNLTELPDVFVVYTGHNEFFYDVQVYGFEEALSRAPLDRWMRWSKSYCLYVSLIDPINTDPQLKNAGWLQRTQFPPLVRQARLKAFEGQLRQFSNYARDHQIPVVWMVPASGESTYQPNRIEPGRDLTQEERQQLKQNMDTVAALMQGQQWQPALAELESVEHVFPNLSEVEFLMGQCHEGLDDWSQARSHYNRAIDLDGFPARANSRYRQVVRDVAKEFQMPCIESPQLLRDLTPHQILDRSVIHDNVHPCLRGHYALGIAVAKEIQTLIQPNSTWESPPDFQTVVSGLDFQKADLALAYRRTAHCLERLCRYRVKNEQRLAESAQYETWADQLVNGELKPGENGTESLTDPARGVELPRGVVEQ